MPRPARPWFRFYVEAMRDPKMRRLTPVERWLWVAILSAARESPVPGVLMVSETVPYTRADLADYAGLKLRDVTVGLAKMTDLGMVGVDDDAFRVTAWADRQYESDTSLERVRKHRYKEQGCNGVSPLPVTPPYTETETDTQTAPNLDPYVAEFAAWWQLYPRKDHRQAAFNAYKARRREGTDPAALEQAVRHYATSVAGTQRRFVLHAKTFLGPAGPWTEHLAEPEPDWNDVGRLPR